jgi:hypothetical protein
MSRLKLAIEQIVFARNYTVWLLDHTQTADWFRQPAEGVTHIAWQVGHLAMAEYRLAVERIRGPRREDAELISDGFLRLFGRDSSPIPIRPGTQDRTRYAQSSTACIGKRLTSFGRLTKASWMRRPSRSIGWRRPSCGPSSGAPSMRRFMQGKLGSCAASWVIRRCGEEA